MRNNYRHGTGKGSSTGVLEWSPWQSPNKKSGNKAPQMLEIFCKERKQNNILSSSHRYGGPGGLCNDGRCAQRSLFEHNKLPESDTGECPIHTARPDATEQLCRVGWRGVNGVLVGVKCGRDGRLERASMRELSPAAYDAPRTTSHG